MRCPRCGKRIGFNQRDNVCPKCGAWLLNRPPSEHQLRHMQKGPGKDDFLNDFPWIGGSPGRRALAFTAVWVISLVFLAYGALTLFITRHFVAAVFLIFVTAIVGTLPKFFLIGSRI